MWVKLILCYLWYSFHQHQSLVGKSIVVCNFCIFLKCLAKENTSGSSFSRLITSNLSSSEFWVGFYFSLQMSVDAWKLWFVAPLWTGASGVGVNELRKRVIKLNPLTFQGPVPRRWHSTGVSAGVSTQISYTISQHQCPRCPAQGFESSFSCHCCLFRGQTLKTWRPDQFSNSAESIK